jgi:hypothetical protein
MTMSTRRRCLTLIAAACLTLWRPVDSFAQTYDISAAFVPSYSDRIFQAGSLFFSDEGSDSQFGPCGHHP